MIELACIIIAVAVYIGTRVQRIVKILEQNQKRDEEARRVRSLEPIKPDLPRNVAHRATATATDFSARR